MPRVKLADGRVVEISNEEAAEAGLMPSSSTGFQSKQSPLDIMGGVNKINSAGEQLRNALIAIPVSAAEGTLNTGISVGNLASRLTERLGADPYQLEHYRFSENLPGGFGSKVGKILGGLIGIGGPQYGSFKAIQGLQGPAKTALGVLGTDFASGAIPGYLMGETEAGNNKDRYLNAALGGIAGAGSKIPRYTDTGAGESVVRRFKDLTKESNKEYGDIFKQAHQKGIDKISNSLTEAEINDISHGAGAKFRKAFEKFEENPTLKAGHKLQSDLGQYITHMDKLNTKRGLQGLEWDSVNAAKEARQKLQDSIYDSLLEKGGMDLPFKYYEAGKKFAEGPAKYKDVQAIRRAAKNPTSQGFIEPWRIPEKLYKESNDPFRRAMMEHHPELEINRMAQSPLAKWGGSILAAGLGIPYIAKKF